MRTSIVLFIAVIALGFSACNREDTDEAARKTGKTLHEIANKTEKAAKEAGRDVKEAAHEARKGWEEADQKDANKKK